MGHRLTWEGYQLDLAERTHVVGILNVTPDSFSEHGLHYAYEDAVAHGIAMAQAGADIIDVGGESTRPYSRRISVQEEMDRVLPVLETLGKEITVPISIDTYKSPVARAAIEAGASIINDISALRFDARMGSLAAEKKIPVILMHMKGTPENMQDAPTYYDLIGEIAAFFREAKERAAGFGIPDRLMVLDPGIGFGKTFDGNLQILRDLDRFRALGCPLMVGSSNKAFIGHILNREAHERQTGTMATVAVAAMNGAHLVRVHEVGPAVETVRIVDAIRTGRAPSPLT